MAGRLQTYVLLLVVLLALSSFFDTNKAEAYAISPSNVSNKKKYHFVKIFFSVIFSLVLAVGL